MSRSAQVFWIAACLVLSQASVRASAQQEESESLRVSKGLQVTLVLDSSNSMQDGLRHVVATALGIVERLSPQDACQVITFGSKVDVVQKWTQNPAELRSSIKGIRRASGTSSLYSALYVALKYGKQENDRRPQVLLVVSDGDDTSSLITRDQLEASAMGNSARVFSILLRIGPDRNRDRFLHSLAVSTGGREWRTESVDALESAVSALAAELERLASVE
jgi:Mg-chelatase subunit ChlD